MGRPLANPFGTLADRFLSDLRSYPQPPAESTLYELSRKLRRLEALFSEWEGAGLIATADPRQVDAAAVKTFLNYMDSRGFTTAYRAKMKQALAKLLTYADNMVLQKLEDSGMVRIP